MISFSSIVKIFPNLAKYSTSKRPLFYGLLPQLSTLMTLLVFSAAIAYGAALWTGAIATMAAFLPIYAKSILAVTGMMALNFWFSREIATSMLSTREVRAGFDHDAENPIDVIQMVEHLTQEVNAYFRKVDPKNHVDMPPPRVLSYTGPKPEISVTEGRNPGRAAIFFSTAMLKWGNTHLNQKQLAALVEVELVKIYLRRGVSNIFVAMGTDLMSTLNKAQLAKNAEAEEENPVTRWVVNALGYLNYLKFFFLYQLQQKRANTYEASEIVAKKLGRGADLIEAINLKVSPTIFRRPTYPQLNEDQARRKRAPYNGPFASVLRYFTDWVDENEYAGDDKTGWRILSFFDICVREAIFYINECFKDEPRATNLGSYLREITGYKDAANDEAIAALHDHDNEVNRELYNAIPAASRYPTIGPDGNGFVEPVKEMKAPRPGPQPADDLAGSPNVVPMRQRQQRQRRGDAPETATPVQPQVRKRRGRGH